MNTTSNRSVNSPGLQMHDLVFAKNNRRKLWPARIESIDNNNMKNTTKYYKVKFYVTNESAVVSGNDVSLYSENKHKHPPESVALRQRDSYKLALSEIQQQWEAANELLNEVGGLLVAKVDTTYSDKQNMANSPVCSTPKIGVKQLSDYEKTTTNESLKEVGGLVVAKQLEISFQQNVVTACSTSPTPSSANQQTVFKNADKTEDTKPVLKDAYTSTDVYLDLGFQVNALTDKCVELEKSLMKERSFWRDAQDLDKDSLRSEVAQNEDFHTQILKKELNKFKMENKSLKMAIEILQSDYKRLGSDFEQFKQGVKNCLHCYPPLQNRSLANTRHPTASTSGSTPKDGNSNNKENATSYTILQEGVFEEKFIETVKDVTKKQTLKNLHKANSRIRKFTEQDNKAIFINKHEERKGSSKVLILADSHGRYLSEHIRQNTTRDVCGVVKPNAKFKNIIKDVAQLCNGLAKNDCVLVIGGTNDVDSANAGRLMQEVHFLITTTAHTNLILASIPMRHDMPRLDLEIGTINAELEKIAAEYPHVNLLPLHLLPRHAFTLHGLHLNRRGKAKVAAIVTDMVDGKKPNYITVAEPPKLMDMYLPGTINIVDGNMGEIIKQNKTDSSIAFAHSISSDFKHPRHMSAGVAVLFKKEFGRPNASDCVTKYLARQKVPDGATIYSLITKSNFWGKPTSSEYDNAFIQLAEHFLSSGLNTLICSPMGCVRDLIPPEQFARDLVDFHKKTNATIFIISCDQKSRRVLRGGLSHTRFLETLRCSIDKFEGKTVPALHQEANCALNKTVNITSGTSPGVVTVSEVGTSTPESSSFKGFSTPDARSMQQYHRIIKYPASDASPLEASGTSSGTPRSSKAEHTIEARSNFLFERNLTKK